MTTRSSNSLVRFRRSFSLSSVDQPLSAGTYKVVVDEAEIGGLSFLAYRRTATMLHLPAIEISQLPTSVVLIDADELAEAIRADGDTVPGQDKTQGTS